MRNPWILLVALVGFIAAAVIAIVGQKRRRKKNAASKNYKPIANTARTRDLPEYKSAQRVYRVLLAVLALLFIITLSATAVIASRPVSTTISKQIYENRDIMLCLDVSGSMSEYTKELLEYFTVLMKEFKGQRIGLTVFDGTYMTLAPLTDDYDLLSDLFDGLNENPSEYTMALYYATERGAGSSAIGPGLVGCINSFDKLEESKRSRAIILSTDNYAQENQAVTLMQAANYAKQYDIAVYGLSTSESRTQEEIDNMQEGDYENARSKEFREAMLATGGSYYAFSSYSTRNKVVVSDLVDKILDQEAVRYEGAETLVKSDVPLVPTIIAVISITLFLIVLWRLGL